MVITFNNRTTSNEIQTWVKKDYSGGTFFAQFWVYLNLVADIYVVLFIYSYYNDASFVLTGCYHLYKNLILLIVFIAFILGDVNLWSFFFLLIFIF